ncbi:MAG: methyltransferase domain-containing protein [Magnetococcus sp. DMHC-6]
MTIKTLDSFAKTATLDQKRLRRAFAKQNPFANNKGDFLPAIAEELLSRLEIIRFSPQRILNLGQRDGRIGEGLRSLFPQAQQFSMCIAPPPYAHSPQLSRCRPLCGDLSRLPYANQSFDCIISNLALHWSPRLTTSLKEIRRVLRPDGLLLFSIMGFDTLQELKICQTHLDEIHYGKIWPRLLTYPTMHQLGDTMANSGLIQGVADRECFKIYLNDPFELLTQLKKMGTGNHHLDRPPGLTGKGYLKELVHLYRQRFTQQNGQIPVTLEILFGHAWSKPTP